MRGGATTMPPVVLVTSRSSKRILIAPCGAFATQCAALSTQSLSISVPVQNQLPGPASSATTVGNSPALTVVPPMIGALVDETPGSVACSREQQDREKPLHARIVTVSVDRVR